MRHPSLFHLFTPVSRIKGVGPAMSETLVRLLPTATQRAGGGLPIIRDLLFHLPSGIVDRRVTFPLREAPADVVATFVVTIDEHQPPKNARYSKAPYKVVCSNATGEIVLVFFHAKGDYLEKMLPVGQQRVISGRTEKFDFHLQMTHPDIIAPVSQLAEVQKPEPVYPLTLGLTSRKIGKLVDEALEKMPELPEWLPSPLEGEGWVGGGSTSRVHRATPHPNPPPQGGREYPSFKQALTQLHHPETDEALSPECPARMRLAHDEILAHQLQLALLRRKMEKQAGVVIKGDGTLSEQLIKSLPYQLTHGQQQVLAEISADLASGKRMIRLLQGDVGSGKTIVALLAMLKASEQGLQCALMAPTELIARQHFEVISQLLAPLPSPLEGEGQGGGWGEHGYAADIAENAKTLRKDPTEAEKKLWNILRSKQLEGIKFRRQQPIGNYIVDFVCIDKKLIVEADGGQHADQKYYDEKRTQLLEALGYRVLRFWNNEILENMGGVYDRIFQTITTPHPTLPLKGGGLEVVLLTGSIKGAARKEVLEKITSGAAKIVIGTHALFQEHVEFHNLSLVVIDEQHRFGVAQRLAMTQKGNLPHILHMTATPIPRSLTMMLYGDMDCSLLKEKPQYRKPITTRLIPKSRYEEVVSRLKAALDRGEKAYWICPFVEDSQPELGEADVAATTLRFTEFKKRFGPIVGLVHGRMKADERNAHMHQFASGETKLLVATTVVEVGVDVKDATIIVIEQAERFGLSQLHQLRGRVGRGEKESACVLLYSEGNFNSPPLEGGVRGGVVQSTRFISPPPTQPSPSRGEGFAIHRLSILRETEDGFKIAETDLALRGGGELLGVRQSGAMFTILVDFAHHMPLVEQARDEAQALLAHDPELKSERGQAAQMLLQLFERDAVLE